jgi:type I restriction enzyme R subunit
MKINEFIEGKIINGYFVLDTTEDEFAFYEALSSNMTAKEVMGTDILKEIAKELTKKIKSSTTIDWNIRDSFRAKIRFEIKVLLKKYNYPPDDPKDPNNYDKSVQLIMEQTELVCENDLGLL